MGAITASATAQEIASQPDLWDQARRRATFDGAALVGSGRAQIIGCGTSAFVAQVVARLREDAGVGETDAAFASDPFHRPYDHTVAISRSATTSEVLQALIDLPRVGHRTAVTAVASPVSDRFDAMVDATIRLPEADEESVVQTRFPTTLIALARAALGETTDLGAHARHALTVDLPNLDGVEHFVFLATGAGVGLANEAALKVREMAQAWSESHVAMDYRHGPIAVAGSRSLVFIFGQPPAGLLADVRMTAATMWCEPDLDSLAQLVVAQRLALALAVAKGLDPDRPNRLTRSVVLPS